MTQLSSHAPLVTIYIPTRNRADQLREALESCYRQTYRDFEIIVVDDGSDDSTRDVVREFASLEQPITCISMGVSVGAPKARNEAIRLAKGEFITGLDDDDVFLSHRLQQFVDAYDPEWSFLCSSAIEWHPHLEICSVEADSVIEFNDIKRRNVVGNQIFIETDRLREVDGFDESFKAWQDYELWFRLISKYGSAYKLGNNSLKVRVATPGERISTSASAGIGFKQFVEKHGEWLTEADLRKQVVNDLVNRRVKLGFRESFSVGFEAGCLVRIFRLYCRTHFPGPYLRLIRWIGMARGNQLTNPAPGSQSGV